MASKQFFPLAALHFNLKRLLLIRLIVIIFQLLALAYAYFQLELALSYSYISTTLSIFILINIGLVFRLKQNWVVNEIEFLGHLLVDILVLSILLYACGGATNPFVSYFLVPVTISAAILPWSYTWVIAGVSLLSYSGLIFFYIPLPELLPMEMGEHNQGNIPNLHIIGMWFNFLVSAALITYFVVKMAAEIRNQQDRLTLYQEDNLRNEQILALATQAAGTAHELGTPLSTIAVLINDMEQDFSDNSALQKNIALLKQQISTCKNSLSELAKQADFRRGSAVKEVSLRLFISQIIDQWQLLRPEIPLQIDWSKQANLPLINVDSTLQQAIVNMLNNAADASPEGVDITLTWTEFEWTMQIRDYGDGVASDIVDYLGSNIISTKQGGMGVGYMLSQASINRLGGHVRLYQHQESGTVTEIQLPFLMQVDAAKL